MSDKWLLSRRTMLRGIGASMALPLLDAMIPAKAAAVSAAPASAAAGGAPVRMAVFFMPNGANMAHWTPDKVGPLGALPPTLAPLARVKDELMVLSGLAHNNARPLGDGPGDHARSAAVFLTGAHPYKTAGADIKAGVSMDQVAAQATGLKTRFPSLELGLDKTQVAGNCDSGYSCAYTSNIAWRSESNPVPKEVDPANLFDRLFGSGSEAEAAKAQQRQLRRRSVLDFVLDDARRLEARLGKTDQRKLDEYLSSVREIEKRIELARNSKPITVPDGAERPDGIPKDFTEHMRLMMDLLVLALQTDSTRVATFMIAREGSDRRYSWLGVSEGHHTVSHHGRKADKIEAIRKIDRYHVEQFAYFLEKMKSVKEGDRTLLDNSMVLLGSGISDGDRHNHDDLPILMAGRAGGAFRTGRHVTYSRGTPLCNLFVSMLNRMGVHTNRFGDSTGALKDLA